MPDNENFTSTTVHRTPWNKSKLIAAKPPLRPGHVWSIRTRLLIDGRNRDLALIDSKLRGCDIVALKVEDIAPYGYTVDRATVRQKKTGRPVANGDHIEDMPLSTLRVVVLGATHPPRSTQLRRQLLFRTPRVWMKRLR
jgi:hypothetical protein